MGELERGRQMHTEGRGVVQHITQLIQERKELGFELGGQAVLNRDYNTSIGRCEQCGSLVCQRQQRRGGLDTQVAHQEGYPQHVGVPFVY